MLVNLNIVEKNNGASKSFMTHAQCSLHSLRFISLCTKQNLFTGYTNIVYNLARALIAGS